MAMRTEVVLWPALRGAPYRSARSSLTGFLFALARAAKGKSDATTQNRAKNALIETIPSSVYMSRCLNARIWEPPRVQYHDLRPAQITPIMMRTV